MQLSFGRFIIIHKNDIIHESNDIDWSTGFGDVYCENR